MRKAMEWGKALQAAGNTILESIAPTGIYCICCGSVIDRSRPFAICDHCIEKFHWVKEETCVKCGKPLTENVGRACCHECSRQHHDFDRGFTCAQYGLYERAVIMDLKYRDKSYLGPRLGRIMARRIALEKLCVDGILPVPLHEKRMAERGYNQAELMAKPVAEALAAPLLENTLRRNRETKAMKDLGYWERRENVEGAFAVHPMTSLEGMHLLLVDDIYTTGATADACSRVLKQAGAIQVDVLTFAASGDGSF